jgi:hypothetical protein
VRTVRQMKILGVGGSSVVTSRRTLLAEIGSAIIDLPDGAFEHVRRGKSVARRLEGVFSTIKPRACSFLVSVLCKPDQNRVFVVRDG